MPTPADLWNLIQGGGALALALFLIVAFMKGWIVPGFIYDRLNDRANKLVDGLSTMASSVDRLTDEVRESMRSR